MLPPDWTRSLPRSIPSFARLPLPGFNTTKALIAGQHNESGVAPSRFFASNYCGKAYPIALSISMVRRTAGRAIIRS